MVVARARLGKLASDVSPPPRRVCRRNTVGLADTLLHGTGILDEEYTQINRGMDFATEGFTMPF